MDVEKLEQRLAAIITRINEIEALLKESTEELQSLDTLDDKESEGDND